MADDETPRVLRIVWSIVVILLAAVLSIAASVWINAYQPGFRVVVVTNAIAVIVGASAATYAFELQRRIYRRESAMEALIAASSKAMADRQDAIGSALGIPARLIPDNFRDGRGDFYRLLFDEIAKAAGGEPIVIISSHQSPPSDPNPDTQKERSRYYELLETKARTREAFIRRILCFAEDVDPNAIPTGNFRRDTLDHVIRLKQIHDEEHGTAIVKKAWHFLPADLLLIGNRFAAVTINVYERNLHTIEVLCWLFHNPPNADVIGHLGRWCTKVDSDGVPIGGFAGKS